MAETKSQLHNRISHEMMMKLEEPLSQGASATEIMVIGESVLVGMALVCIRLGGDEIVLDAMFERAKRRLAKIRLGKIETRGSS